MSSDSDLSEVEPFITQTKATLMAVLQLSFRTAILNLPLRVQTTSKQSSIPPPPERGWRKQEKRKSRDDSTLSFRICYFGAFGRKEVYLVVTFSKFGWIYIAHFLTMISLFLEQFWFDGVKVKTSTCYSRSRNFRLKVKRWMTVLSQKREVSLLAVLLVPVVGS